MSCSRRVMLVEDEEDVRESLKDFIEDSTGCLVVAAANGAEALQLLGDVEPPCLILLDLLMPVMDGWTFLAELRRRPELDAIPVVITTSMPAETAPPGLPVLRKPLDSRLLLRHLGDCCVD